MAFSALLLFHGTPSCWIKVKSLSRYFTVRSRRASAASERKVWVARDSKYLSTPLVFLQVAMLEAVPVDGLDDLTQEGAEGAGDRLEFLIDRGCSATPGSCPASGG